MNTILEHSELFEGLPAGAVERVATVAKSRSLHAGEYLFLLGDDANQVFIVQSGKLEICLPLVFRGTVKDTIVDTRTPGRSIGWSAFARPYRFTMSARAAEPSEVIGFARKDLLDIFGEDPHIGFEFMRRIAEVIGQRLLKVQALWGRELQRAVADGMAGLVVGGGTAPKAEPEAADQQPAREQQPVGTRGDSNGNG